MALIAASSMQGDFDLQFITTAIPNNPKAYKQKINTFLGEIFDYEAPLAYCAHHQFNIQNAKAVMVRFQLSEEGQDSAITMDEAAERLCTKIFQPQSRHMLAVVTDRSILGISPVSPRFQNFWNKAFFSEALNRGPSLLREIDRSFTTEYLPSWALVLSFAVVAGMNFAMFVNGPIEDQQVNNLIGAVGSGFATTILKRYTGLKPKKPMAQQLEEWKASYSNMKSDMDVLVDALKALTTPAQAQRRLLTDASNQHSAYVEMYHRTPQEELCNALFNACKSAAIANTTNEDTLDNFLHARLQAEKSMAAGIIGSGASLWALSSAFFTTTATTVSMAPLATWGLADFVGLVLLGEVPAIATTTTTLWWCPPLAIAATAGAIGYTIFTYKKNQDRRKFNRRCAYHRAMDTFINRAHGLAYDTRMFLEWIHCTKAANPDTAVFVSDEARLKWESFIRKLREVAGGTVKPEELTAQFVLTFLKIQMKSLEQTRKELAAIDQSTLF